MKPSIFICYRRDDSSGYAGRLRDKLVARFPNDAVFMDVESTEAGLDFVEVLKERIETSDVLLVLIGQRWLEARSPDGVRRLDDPDDFVRIEIEAALKRGIRVIPVLVDGAQMPRAEDLPMSLAALARRQSHELSHNRFEADTERLRTLLASVLTTANNRPSPAGLLRRLRLRHAVVVAVTAGILALLASYLSGQMAQDKTASSAVAPIAAATNAASRAIKVSAPQTYVQIQHDFKGADPVYYNGAQHGFYRYEFDFKLTGGSPAQAGTFWANQFTFRDSTGGLPSNHIGGDQGGYIGVQALSATESIAIFSIWWAVDAKAGDGATCASQTEAWYADDKPFMPSIQDITSADSTRKIAGGPFRSCRLPIKLLPNVRYRLSLYELSDATAPNEPEWWGASLVDVEKNEEHFIGAIRVPGPWGWLNSASTFIEHFGPMPDGCGSIPPTETTFFAAVADAGKYRSTLSADLAGDCEAALQSRTNIDCTEDSCTASIK